MRPPPVLAFAFATAAIAVLAAGRHEPVRATNVLIVTLDGLRWQELFGGADSSLLSDTTTTHDRTARARYWRPTAEERRAALMPFLWSVVATEGQVFGDRASGGGMRVTNGRKFSYPGYQEMLAGYPDSAIDSNAKRPNRNVTVLEWLLTRPGLAGHVAVFSTWDVFPYIVNEERSGIPVNAGWEPLVLRQPTPAQDLLNALIETLPRVWEGERYDALTYQVAREYLLAERPNVLYLALGETDDWAHEDRYDRYLDAARNGDAFIRQLWDTLQGHPRYRHRTALVVTTDHGRGAGRAGWSRHGADVDGAEWMWAAVLGPDTPPLGSRSDVADATQAQIAATIAALLGEDYRAAQPRAAAPLPGVLR
jgi:hypothetical protein